MFLPYPFYPHSVVPVTKGHLCYAHLLVSLLSSSTSSIACHTVSITCHTVSYTSPTSSCQLCIKGAGYSGLVCINYPIYYSEYSSTTALFAAAAALYHIPTATYYRYTAVTYVTLELWVLLPAERSDHGMLSCFSSNYCWHSSVIKPLRFEWHTWGLSAIRCQSSLFEGFHTWRNGEAIVHSSVTLLDGSYGAPVHLSPSSQSCWGSQPTEATRLRNKAKRRYIPASIYLGTVHLCTKFHCYRT